jgi:DNA-binding response OmpR family regulator
LQEQDRLALNSVEDFMITVNKALVVDNHKPTCSFIADALRASNIDAYGITDSTRVDDCLQNQSFDAVFLASNMPAPDGLELAGRIRRSPRHRKSLIVLLGSDAAERNFISRAYEAGANFILFKPLDQPMLTKLLRVTRAPIERERRRCARVEVQCPMTVGYGKHRISCSTINLSMTGALIGTPHVFPTDAALRFELMLDSDRSSITGSARVIRQVADESAGIEFQGLDSTAFYKLEEFLLPHILKLENQ